MLPHDAKRADALDNPYDEEVRDILWIDVPARVNELTQRQRLYNTPTYAYFGRGITLKVTEKQAQVIIEDPTDEALAEVERSGHSFLVVR